MRVRYIILLFGIVFTNCKTNVAQKKEEIDKKDYLELGKDINNKNYEVKELLGSNFRVFESENSLGKSYFFLDTKTSKLIFDCLEKKITHTLSGIGINNLYGEKIEILSDEGTLKILSDGTLWEDSYYSNALLNNDDTKHSYINPFSNKEIDDIYNVVVNVKLEDWYQKFKELYQKATMVKIDMNFYYLKVEETWYFIYTFKNAQKLDIDFKKEYPEKSTIKRMLPLEKEIIKFYLPPEERTNKILEEIDYESTYYEEKDNGLITSNYSAGWWYLHINMPNDTIKIKRYASYKNPKMTLFKIPKEYGGSNEVLFIVLESSSMHKEQKAGLYVVRVKNYKQLPEYKPFLEKTKQDGLKNRRSFTN